MTSRKQQGVAAVELALIMVPMLTLCFGITELGRALYCYNGLVKATRGAVRYLAANPTASETEVKNLALCGALTCGDPLAPGLTLAQISVATYSSIPTGQGSADLVSVTIGGTGAAAYEFTSLVPWVVPSFTFAPVTTTMASQ